MSIVINGSGTISGISVGGLPDSIVDAGTLATDSVDSAELIDGAVDDSHMAAMAASKLTGALPAGVTGGSGLTALGTVTSGNLSNNAIIMPRYKEFDRVVYATETTTTSTGQTAFNISGSTYVTLTPEHVDDIFLFQFQFNTYCSAGYMGWGIQRATDTGFTTGVTTIYANGVHSSGRRGLGGDATYVPVEGIVTLLATGLSVDTPYYFRLIGQNHTVAATFKWGVDVSGNLNPAAGFVLSARRWSIV
jgi:hypothetical protein